MPNKTFPALIMTLFSIVAPVYASGYQISVANRRPLLDAGHWASVNYSRIRPHVTDTLQPQLNIATPYSTTGGYIKFDYNKRIAGMLEYYTPYHHSLSYGEDDFTTNISSRGYALSGKVSIVHGFSAILGYHLVSVKNFSLLDIYDPDLPANATGLETTAAINIREASYGLSYEYQPMALKLMATVQGNTKFSLPFAMKLDTEPESTADAPGHSRTPTNTLLSAEMNVSTSTSISASYLHQNWRKAQLFLEDITPPITQFANSSQLHLGVAQRVMPGITLNGHLAFAPKSSGAVADMLSPVIGSRSIGIGLSYHSDNYLLKFKTMRRSHGQQTLANTGDTAVVIDNGHSNLFSVEGKVKLF